MCEQSVALASAGISRRVEGVCRLSLAEVLRLMGDRAAAEQQAMAADRGFASHAPTLRSHALGMVAQLRLEEGDVEGARAAATDALSMPSHAMVGYVMAARVLAEALDALGDPRAAREAIRLARDQLSEQAARVSDPRMRESFLRNVPENARTLELAAQWLGAGDERLD